MTILEPVEFSVDPALKGKHRRQAAGAFGSAAEGVQALVRLDRTFEPDPSSHARYSEIRAAYDEVFATVRESYPAQAAIAFPDHHPNRET